nr:ABC transporter permease [uncultured Methanospirillum sp.]
MKNQIIPLIITLVKRDIVGKYRQATFGSLYAIIQPVGFLLTFFLLGKVVGVNSEGIPYVLMLLTGLVPWLFFCNSINASTGVIRMNADLIKKMPVTKEIFLIVGIIVAFVDFLVSSILLIIVAIYYQIPLTLALLWLPVIIAVLVLLILGLGFIVAAISAIRTDLQFLLPFLLQLWMFASPVIYPLKQVPESVVGLYKFNPITGIVESFRIVIAYGHAPDMQIFGISILAGIILILIGWPLFRYYGQFFADVI